MSARPPSPQVVAERTAAGTADGWDGWGGVRPGAHFTDVQVHSPPCRLPGSWLNLLQGCVMHPDSRNQADLGSRRQVAEATAHDDTRTGNAEGEDLAGRAHSSSQMPLAILLEVDVF